jgi:hypothetical protein
MPSLRSLLLALVLFVAAACPAAAVAQDYNGDGDSTSYYDDGSDYADDGDYSDEGDYVDDGSDYSDDESDYSDDCAAYLEDPEDDGWDTCDDTSDDTGLTPPADTPDLTPTLPSIPRPVGPTLVHLHANGKVWASPKLPRRVRQVIAAANRIATKPYRYGGGHGSFNDKAYDCSGSVSYALHGAGLLYTTLTSGGLARWGAKGKGKWITVYANRDHTYMVIAGMRFDTGARPRGGTRWDPWERPARGFAVRHPVGL